MAVAGDWAATPPEVLWYQLMAGDQALTTAASAIAHQALSDALAAEGAAMGVNTAATTAGGWEGAGGVAMMASSTEYIAALELLTAWVQESSQAANGIAEAYHTAAATMVPGPVSDTNRANQAEAVATNFFGVRTPEIIGYDTEYFGHHWPTNAAAMAAYESVTMGLLGLLGIPPPISPVTGDPAGAAAQAAVGAAQAGVQAGNNAAMQSGVQGMNETAGAMQPAEQAPAAAGQAVTSVAPMLMGQLGQIGQMAGQLPQMAGQLPSMFAQMPQMATGMLGPLASGFSSFGSGVGAEPATAAVSQMSQTLPPGGLGAGGAGGGGGGLGAPGASGVVSSFTRPASSFNAPAQPKLPSGWSSVVEPSAQVAGATQPAAGSGMGGLYGAPAAMGHQGGAPAEKAPSRTMHLTGRPAARRGSDHEN
jgi:PPE-repeat protein